jgi:hypothetical protein
MYFIGAMARTSSSSAATYLKLSLAKTNPLYLDDLRLVENFILSSNLQSTYQFQAFCEYRQLMSKSYQPVIKMMVTNASWLVNRFLTNQKYTSISILPDNLLETCKKTHIANITNSWGSHTDRKHIHDSWLSNVETPTELWFEEYIHRYTEYLKFAEQTDYTFYSSDLEDYNKFLTKLGLHSITEEDFMNAGGYKWVPPHYSSDELLKDHIEFEDKFNNIYERLILRK